MNAFSGNRRCHPDGYALYLRTSPKFTAPTGKYGWLNSTIFVSAIRFDPAKPGVVIIDVYKVL